MASLNTTAGNCGIAELYGLDHTARTLIEVARPYAGKYGHIWFSDADANGNGQRLEQEILSHNLGAIVRSPSRKNPNTGNPITGYIWSPNVAAIDVYLGIKK